MIRIRYKELFDLEVLYNFYENGKSADFKLVPSAACNQVLKNFGLHFVSSFGNKWFKHRE